MMERTGQARCLETLADIATVESNSGERERDLYAKNRLNYSSFCRVTFITLVIK